MGKFNGMSGKNIENTTKSDINFAQTFVDHHARHCLVNNIYIPKKSNKSIYFLHTRFTVQKCKLRFYIRYLLIWSVKLTKNSDLDECKYSGYSIGFDFCSKFLLPDGTMEKMSLFLELILAYLCMLTMKGKIY